MFQHYRRLYGFSLLNFGMAYILLTRHPQSPHCSWHKVFFDPTLVEKFLSQIVEAISFPELRSQRWLMGTNWSSGNEIGTEGDRRNARVWKSNHAARKNAECRNQRNKRKLLLMSAREREDREMRIQKERDAYSRAIIGANGKHCRTKLKKDPGQNQGKT